MNSDPTEKDKTIGRSVTLAEEIATLIERGCYITRITIHFLSAILLIRQQKNKLP